MTSREIKELAKNIVVEQMKYEVMSIDDVAKILNRSAYYIMEHLEEIPHGVYGKRPIFFRGDVIAMLRR